MFGSDFLFSGQRGFYPITIDQSLRFNDNDSAYLSRTPASAGNQKTWTFSAWIKRANTATGSNQYIFSAGTDTWLRYQPGGALFSNTRNGATSY